MGQKNYKEADKERLYSIIETQQRTIEKQQETIDKLTSILTQNKPSDHSKKIRDAG